MARTLGERVLIYKINGGPGAHAGVLWQSSASRSVPNVGTCTPFEATVIGILPNAGINSTYPYTIGWQANETHPSMAVPIASYSRKSLANHLMMNLAPFVMYMVAQESEVHSLMSPGAITIPMMKAATFVPQEAHIGPTLGHKCKCGQNAPDALHDLSTGPFVCTGCKIWSHVTR